MTLRVTNSLTGEREPFTPRDPESVLLYFCGLTVSDRPHLGHARAWVHVDVMRRWLGHRGYDVKHVENFTDVNEKIVARIGEDGYGGSETDVARYFIDRVIDDMRSLNLERAHVYPRVSEHIPEITALIERLVDAGYAYESGGSVYFDVTAFDGYGKLSNQRLDEIESQGDPAELAEKRHPADFALWKAGAVDPAEANEHRDPDAPPLDSPAGETWESPWGVGRPGWHIECSAMAMTHLDEHIDIHVGGQDLVFPHHENEIAQTEAATGEAFADYWLHVRLLETEGEKMSSSLRNYFTVANAVEAFGANAVRMFLLSTVYSRPQAYTEDSLHEAAERWASLERARDRAVDAADSPDAATKPDDDGLGAAVRAARAGVRDALDDDFNTRVAIRELLDLAGAVNRHLDAAPPYAYPALREALEAFDELAGAVLGFRFDAAEPAGTSIADDLVELVLAIRDEERDAGNYERADAIRADLEALGVTVEDTDDGVEYRR